MLQSTSREGDRALLLYPPGLDFIAAYFACLYARVLAVPVYPPHPARLDKTLSIIQSIVADAGPAVMLLSSSLRDVIMSREEIRAGFANMELLATDKNEAEDWSGQWKLTEIKGKDKAFLQYTSGSTTNPKGVVVSHGNLLHNLELIAKCFGASGESRAVIWLPPYHDMGLIGGILQPLYSGFPVTLIPHMQILQRPYRWLHAISRFKGTISGGPNFAYELCINKIKPEKREQLDLSHWDVAFNGAEPVYHHTLDRFTDYFAPCGFRRRAFLPCYGLAESTLMVTGGPKDKAPLTQNLVNSGLMQDRVIISPEKNDETRTLVSCGQNLSDQKIRIVNVESQDTCPDDKVGEIWISGPSIAMDYWNKPEESMLTFGARLSDSKEGPFLRTGDYGFLHEGELYITGRIKNLIISGGKNHYPQDIERIAESSHPAIRPAGCAVFSINNSESEDIIVVVEVLHKLNVKIDEVKAAIRNAVSTNHGLYVHDIKLTRPGSIPRTTSGKIKHYLCKKEYMNGNLKEIILT
jgi:acyl-CoA synthetase (AMP-forming)/AMP-acid ligase II